MLKRIFSGLLYLFVCSVTAQAADKKFLEQIDRAGEQRMLTQRITKSFLQLGLNVQPLVAKQELDEATTRFEHNLVFLETGAGGDMKNSLDHLRASWLNFRSATRGLPSLPSAVWLSHQGDEVLHAAERVVRALQNSSPNATLASGRLVAQAGRQRMLSQRIVKAYLLLSWGDRSELTREELETSVNEFAGALSRMRSLGDNPPDVQRELEEMSQHWEWMKAALSADGANSYRLIVAEAGEAILQSSERLTKLYASAP